LFLGIIPNVFLCSKVQLAVVIVDCTEALAAVRRPAQLLKDSEEAVGSHI
jgi:hypothetical protein